MRRERRTKRITKGGHSERTSDDDERTEETLVQPQSNLLSELGLSNDEAKASQQQTLSAE